MDKVALAIEYMEQSAAVSDYDKIAKALQLLRLHQQDEFLIARKCAYAASNYFDDLYMEWRKNHKDGDAFTSSGTRIDAMTEIFKECFKKL